jgi:hypothetical protein
MSTYDDASLVLVPSGYKNGVVFSQKPMDANGQLTFTRASDATRVGPNGYIEKVRTNLLLQSNTFSNAAWSKLGTTITSGQSDPNGGTNAYKVEIAAGGNNYLYQSVPNPAGEKTISCWIKADSATTIAFGTGGATPNQINVTTTWTRYSFTSTDTTGGMFFGNYFPIVGNPALTFYVFQSQYEMGVMTDYIATTTAAVSVGPVSGTPRLDYLGSDCPRLLLEPQRSNLLPMSEQMNNATFWNSVGGALTITPNVTISPDGYQNADSITLSNTANRYFVSEPISLTPSAVYTYSVYMKSASGTLDIFMSGVNGLTGQMKSVTTEWQRFTLTFTMHANGSEYFGIDQRASGSSTSGTLYFWGAQVELGAYATSYIPTLGTAVTRVADEAQKESIASLIGQTAGTIYWESNQVGGAQISLNASASVSSDGVQIYGSDNTLNVYIQQGGSVRLITSLGAVTQGTDFKIALAYGTNFVRAYINGVQTYTTSATIPMPTLAMLNLSFYGGGGAAAKSETKQVLLFKSILTDAQLAELTTL